MAPKKQKHLPEHMLAHEPPLGADQVTRSKKRVEDIERAGKAHDAKASAGTNARLAKATCFC